MEAKQFGSADARRIIERVVTSVPTGCEREALLILASETLREATAWLEAASGSHIKAPPLLASAPARTLVAGFAQRRRA